MPNARTINLVTQPSKDRAAITLALIGFVITIIASLITAAATLLGALIVVSAESKQQMAQCCCIPRDDWKDFARTNGWIPRTECPWESRRSSGQDSHGRKVEVQIHLLAGEYRWVLKSSSEIELGDKNTSLATHIRGLEISSKAKVIVGLGMASVEGNFPSQSVLAEERTDRLIRLIKDELRPDIPVHGLSLGRYVDETTNATTRETAGQRRVVVIEVFEPEEGAVLQEAVYDALIKAREAPDKIPFDVRDYKDRNYTDHGFGRLKE